MYGDMTLRTPEVSHSYLNYLSAVIDGGTLFVYICYGAIISFFTLRAASNLSLNPFYFLIVNLPFHIVMLAVSGVRQGAAESIVVFAVSLLLLKRTKYFALLILFATTFHSSALVFLVLVFINSKTRYMVLALLLTLPIMLYFSLNEYGHYIESNLYNQGIFLRVGFLILNVMIIIRFRKQWEQLPYNSVIRFNWFIIFSVPLLIGIALLSTTMADRLSYYFILLSSIPALALISKQRSSFEFIIRNSLFFVSFTSVAIFGYFGNNGPNYFYDSYLYRWVVDGEFPEIDSSYKIRGG